ncbi:MAG: hypothetical protein KIS77_15690 [Saprospiraceae bacterium]|nr:hypothetical protein [Saprospiraceae bacterium]
MHHLYAIIDGDDDSIYKYGITDNVIDADGLSDRVREQVDLFNRIAGFPRFYAKILLREIPGRRQAREIERQHIQAFEKNMAADRREI